MSAWLCTRPRAPDSRIKDTHRQTLYFNMPQLAQWLSISKPPLGEHTLPSSILELTPSKSLFYLRCPFSFWVALPRGCLLSLCTYISAVSPSCTFTRGTSYTPFMVTSLLPSPMFLVPENPQSPTSVSLLWAVDNFISQSKPFGSFRHAYCFVTWESIKSNSQHDLDPFMEGAK